MKKRNFFGGVTFLLFVISGCSSSMQKMESRNIVPGAQGTVIVKSAENDNTDMTVKVKYLAPATTIRNDANNYVVWIQPLGSRDFQNVGGLNINEKLEGMQTTTIPYKRFKVLVTPEKSNTAMAPTGPVIFEKQVIRQ